MSRSNANMNAQDPIPEKDEQNALQNSPPIDFLVRNIPRNTHRHLKAIAAIKGDTMGNIILQAIEEYLQNLGVENGAVESDPDSSSDSSNS